MTAMIPTSTGDWWPWFLGTFAQGEVPTVSYTQIVVILLVSAALSVPRATWRYFGLVSTITHELGHAFANLTAGRLITGITLNLDHSGETRSYGRRGFGTVWSGFWGYPVPAVVGSILVWAGLNGWAPAAMSIGTIILIATVLFIRNLMGLLILLGTVATSIALILFVPAAFTGHLVIALGLALLVASVRDLVNVISVHTRRRDRLPSSDAYLLYRSTGIPSPVWLLLFTAVIGAAWFFTWQSVAGSVLT